MRLTKRFIVKSLDEIPLTKPIRYERYYINDKLRIQKKDNRYEKEVLSGDNSIVEKCIITESEFFNLKKNSHSKIIRNSYIYLLDNRVSIKEYLGDYKGLNRIEVKFSTIEEMNSYVKENWFGKEITSSSLAFDKDLSKLSREEFLLELNKYLK